MSAPVTVTQADREAAASGYYAWIGPNPRIPEKMVDGNADDHSLVQAFARHRHQAEAASKAREAELVEALASARKIIRDVEDYMACPDRGDWGVECALCMGELFDDDRDAIAAIDAALAKASSDGGEG